MLAGKVEGRKRKRRAGSRSSGDGGDPNASSTAAPPPPPPPPQSLVDLLQSDAAVLQYFASLQSNLEADVGAWRDKAQKYKREAVSLRRKLDQAETIRGHRQQNERKKHAKKSSTTNRGRKTSNSTNLDVANDNKDEDDHVDGPLDISSVDRADILSQLAEAYNCFEQLGVSLVDESYAPASGIDNGADGDDDIDDGGARGGSSERDAEENEGNEGDAASSSPAAVAILTRRSDHDVAADLMKSLRSLVRVSSHISAASSNDDSVRDLARQYDPFRPGAIVNSNGNVQDTMVGSECLLPCCHELLAGQHPAADGLRLATRALTIIDTFCGPVLSSSFSSFDDRFDDCSWDELFESNIDENNVETAKEDTKLEYMRQGMRGRRELVDSIVLSLQGEITTRWAAEDRFVRLDAGTLLYEDAEAGEGQNGSDEKVSVAGCAATSHSQPFDSRSYNRLALLVDRIMYARLASAIYQHRCQSESAEKLVLGYLTSSMPSLGVEDYPRHSPVLSFCVLEGLLSHLDAGKSLLGLSFSGTPSDDSSIEGANDLLNKILGLSLRGVLNIWKDRKSSSDGRINDIARVEMAAFSRIEQSQRSPFAATDEVDGIDEDEVLQLARNILTEIVSVDDSGCTDIPSDESRALPLLLCLILIGDIRLVAEISSKMEAKLRGASETESSKFVASCMLLACCHALQAIRSRNLRALPAHSADNILTLEQVLGNLKTATGSSDDGPSRCLPILAECSAVLANGLGVRRIVPQSTIDFSCSTPVIRVINLERRSDRWSSIVGQARASQLLIVRGPASLLEASDSDSDNDADNKAYWGNYAFDGRGDVDFTSTSISIDETSTIRLTDFVTTHWYPSKLKAFDRNAKDEEVSVPASATERACALSHIACWRGVERSLRSIPNSIPGDTTLITDIETNAGRLLRISGFATGPALLHENRAMPPAPVCVIMEDDAVLVDRFRDRLDSLLSQLPRDFHFCSLGYGRPKNAPMIEFSEAVGIPTFLWYLTGYVLSMEGAKLLLDDLPVLGPVDSWIGLKVSSNWENEYGYSIGVGRDARKSRRAALATAGGATHDVSATTDGVLARKDLARLMKFRAFAALVPLCSQKVGQGGHASSSAAFGAAGGSTKTKTNQRIIAKWRDRDSDIVYSGGNRQNPCTRCAP